MRKCYWITPFLLLAACSRSPSSKPQAQTATTTVQAAEATPPPNPQPASDAAASPVTAEPAPPLPAPVAAEPAPVRSAEYVIPEGTLLRVRVDESLSTRRNSRGDHFTATLMNPVVVDGRNVLPVGTRFGGHVVVSSPSHRLKGRARLVLVLDSLDRDGHRYAIRTTAAARVSGSHKKRNFLAIGGGAAGGAGIGAIAGGGLGAAIGAGAGAAAGTVGAAITGKKQVTLPAESVVRFRLGAPVRV